MTFLLRSSCRCCRSIKNVKTPKILRSLQNLQELSGGGKSQCVNTKRGLHSRSKVLEASSNLVNIGDISSFTVYDLKDAYDKAKTSLNCKINLCAGVLCLFVCLQKASWKRPILERKVHIGIPRVLYRDYD